MNRLNNIKVYLTLFIFLLINLSVLKVSADAESYKSYIESNSTVCEIVGCKGGSKDCATVRITRPDNPVDKIYLCYSSILDEPTIDF